MGRADDILHFEQRVPSADDRLIFIDVHRTEPRAASLEGFHQRALGNKAGATRIDDKRARFHAREVLARNDAAGLVIEWKVETHDITFGEKGFSVFGDLIASVARAARRTRASPTNHPCAESAPDISN